ncbi:MAG: Elongation factor G [Phycisphaerae bacterium]|nr:Elongation factor G [Phycisphaerae bacterium]
MGAHQIGDFRNMAVVGHTGCGKTTLGEALLHKSGATTRLGSVDDNTSMLDFDEESKERKHSIDSSIYHIEHGGRVLNFVDTPGSPDHVGPAMAGLIGVETAVVVVSASAGIEVNTRRMFNAAGDCGLGRVIVINKIDAENADLEGVVNAITESFGQGCVPINLPSGGGKSVIDVFGKEEGAADILSVAECHTALLERIVETDDALMEEYMANGTIAADRVHPVIGKAVATGRLIPILFTNARGGAGVQELLDALVTFAPSPLDGKQRSIEREGAAATPVVPKQDGDFVAQVFKITADPKSNIKYSVARVLCGVAKGDSNLHIGGERKTVRPGHLFKLRGDQHHEIPEATAGDIIAFAKLDLHIGSMVGTQPVEGKVPLPKFPTPMYALAVEPKSRGDIEKIGGALHKFMEEDPCFHSHREAQTGELVIQGLGDQHLNIIRSRMKRLFKLEVDTKAPKIPYRETITGSVKYVEYTHKKQTGGAGQFAKVAIDMEPNERGKGYEFADKIFGGAIDLAFRPAVDKGVQAQMKQGVIAGCPVVDVKVSLVDGKTHPVDSKDIAFQIAGKQAFKKAFAQCRPILLEPIVTIEVTAPSNFVGDITRDLAGKRGQILGQDILPGNIASIKASVPLGEVATYNSQLKSVTGGQGSYSMEFSHYDIVPPMVQAQIVAAYKPHEEEE